MSFQICIKTEKSLQQLASEIRNLFSLPAFKLDTFIEEPYCQFEMFGLIVLLRKAESEDRDPEIADYAYCFDLQAAFTESQFDTDMMEYHMQPYYAQLLAFQLDIETAYFEKRKIGEHWQIRYCFLHKNPQWNGNILYGEPGWSPAVVINTSNTWRSIHPIF